MGEKTRDYIRRVIYADLTAKKSMMLNAIESGWDDVRVKERIALYREAYDAYDEFCEWNAKAKEEEQEG